MNKSEFYGKVLTIIKQTTIFDDGVLYFYECFGSVDEPGDVAWDSYYDTSKDLEDLMEEFKLEIVDFDSDNDSYWFTVQLEEGREL